jgi:hypothetical protein
MFVLFTTHLYTALYDRIVLHVYKFELLICIYVAIYLNL